MKLSTLGEFGLIDRIRRQSGKNPSAVLVGMGDDAAVLRTTGTASLLATTDMLLEGVHFDLAYTDFRSLGWKAAAVNLSDVAAMGGQPRFCLVALGIPPHHTAEQVAEFYRGLRAALRPHHTVLVGGDTCASADGLVVCVTMLGEASGARPVTRSNARPGDLIFVTGMLGDSAAGLELLQHGAGRASAAGALVRRHLRPIARVAWGRKIAQAGCAHAMIDVSDGLSSDLGRLCDESGTGAVIDAARIPLSRSLQRAAGRLRFPALHYALSGGEEYELLFTTPPARIAKLRALGIAATAIGVVTRGRGLFLTEGGRIRSLSRTGYDHFSGRGERRGRRRG